MNIPAWSRTERGIQMPLGEGRMEVVFVTPTVVRVRYSASDTFAPRRSWSPVAADKTFDMPPVMMTNREGTLTLESGVLAVTVVPKTGKVRFKIGRASGRERV